MIENGTKQCGRCKKRKPVKGEQAAFYKDKDIKDGFRGYCKPCEKKMAEQYAKNAAKGGKKAKTKKAPKRPAPKRAPKRPAAASPVAAPQAAAGA